MELGLHENDGRDMISNLPDCIIGSILSFLPTKDAVRTCVLSKRWKNLWTFVTELSFQEDRDPIDDTQIKKTQFLHFVHRVLLHLVDGLTINSFSLSVYYYYDDSHLNECISCILSRKVKKIWFDSQNVHRVFPFYPLFQFESLEELFLINCSITVPSFNTLSSLTTLKLSLVTVTCYKPNELKDLTLDFPVLRKFVTEECWWTNVKSVTIQAPLLEVVSMDYGPYVGSNAEIKFRASHLTMFSYAGCFVSETISLDAVHIASANIMLYDSIKSLEETRLFVSKLMSINAASLKLCGLHNKKVLQGVKLSLNNILGFQILGHLDLDFAPDDILFSFLLKSPRLETLVLKGVAHLHKDVFTSVMVPHCFLSSFKVFQFKGFNANEQDLCLVKFVLANAANLEKMTISPAFWLRCADVDLEKVKEQILSIPKCSKNCKIEVSDISSS